MLADLLDDNAVLHALYGMLEGRDPAAGVRAAAVHVEALRARTAHAQMRTACGDALAALAGLEGCVGSEEAIAETLRRAEAATGDPRTSRDERRAHLVRRQLLRHLLGHGSPGIPRNVHLIRTDTGDRDLPLVQYLCYRSVLAHCRGWRVILHTRDVPKGLRWGALLPHLDVRLATPPQWLGDRRLMAAAHQSDVWRLRQVIDHGGFYFDWDLFLLRSPEPLRRHPCVMALERKEEGYLEVLGVSMIGAEPGSVFLQHWLDEMASVFNPRKYVAHSVVLAQRLATELPALVRVLDYRSFYDPGWGEAAMKWLFDPAELLPEQALRERLREATGMHLFCSHANFLRWAPTLAERDIDPPRCNLAVLLRPYL
jgi:hypothetical protein